MDYRIFYVIALTLAVTLHLQKNPEATFGDYCEGNNCTATETCTLDNKCECSSDSYQSGNECLPSSPALVPVITSITTTSDSLTITWTRQDDPFGYTSTYFLDIGGNEYTLTDLTQSFTGLSSNTNYSVVIRRYITYNSVDQGVLESTPSVQIKTKSGHGGPCGTSNDACDDDLTCMGSTCVCPADKYFPGTLPCVPTSSLKPAIDSYTSTYNSFTVTWSRPADPAGYTSMYTLEYSGIGSPVVIVGDSDSQTTQAITGFSSNKDYNVVIKRLLVFNQNEQHTIVSEQYQVKTKSGHGQPCSSNNCANGLRCQGSLCICEDGFYHKDKLPCISATPLTPAIDSDTSTYNSFTVTWRRPVDPAGYRSRYTLEYPGISPPVAIIGGADSQTTGEITGLTPNKNYSITINRYLSFNNHGQSALVSSPYQVKTKSSHNEPCFNNTDCARFSDSSRNLQCYSGTQSSVCVCPNGQYYNGSIPCSPINELIPDFDLISSDLDSITLELKNTHSVDRYNIAYKAQLNPGDITHDLQSGSNRLPGLEEGKVYTITVTVTLTLIGVGKTQTTGPSPAKNYSTKVSYGNECITNGTCINDDSNCYGGRCRCNLGFYWRENTCNPISELAPVSVQAEVLNTTSVKVTWQHSSQSSFVSAYRVKATPTDSDPDLPADEVPGVGATTTTLTGLQPGTRYRFSVESKSTNDGRVEYAQEIHVNNVTRPAKIERLDEVNSNFSAPDMKIAFPPAVQKFSTYTVTVNGENDGFSERKTATGPTEGYYFAVFGGVTTGNYYTVTVVTNSVDFSMSEPFTKRQRVMADQASEVQNFVTNTITSRSVAVRWTQPAKPNGRLFEYSLEINKDGTCISRIVFNCTSCSRNFSVFDDTAPLCPLPTTIEISEEDINDKVHEFRHNVTSLDPDTSYTIQAIAYNEDGRGRATFPLDVHTESEPAKNPKSVTTSYIKANHLTLTWVPEIPRPGNTSYVVEILERNVLDNQFHTLRTETVFGYNTNSLDVETLSSYWEYQFSVKSQSEVGQASGSVQTNVITTLESAPRQVVDLEAKAKPDLYDKVQLIWKCPPQKDGRNGVILNATVKYETDTQRDGVTPKTGEKPFHNEQNRCSWDVALDVTAEFNYTFTVFISNSFAGATKILRRYMPPGPAVIREGGVSKQQKEVSEKENSFPFTICPRCLREGRNGFVESSGILVCKNNCPTTQKKRETNTKDHYEQVDNWQKASATNFNNLYRATPSTWLPLTDQDNWVYEIGQNSSCDKSDENGFCNGPLPEGSTYLVIVFVCTAAGCDESEPVSIKTKEPPSYTNVIVGAVCGVLAAIVIVIALIVFLKWRNKVLRPRSQENRLPRYVSDTADKDDTYDEIADGNIQSVVQDGRPEVDYYNMRDNPPRFENIYDQLRVYSNQGQHDYGRIKVTQT